MEDINTIVLKELQDYAQMYFAAIMEANTIDGVCTIKPGKYSAKDMIDSTPKGVTGGYALPEDDIFDEDITISAGAFGCTFPYRHIFAILAKWEAQMSARKQKAVFEIGDEEEKSVKVILNEKTELGAYKTKTMKLRRIGGNWWASPKEIRKEGETTGYYELNGVMFAPGKSFWGNIKDGNNQEFMARNNDTKMSELIKSFITNEARAANILFDYLVEVAKRAGIDTPEADTKGIAATPTETPQISTKTATVEDEPTEEVNAPKTAKEAERVITDWCFSIPKNAQGLSLGTGATCNAKTLRTLTMRIELRNGMETLRYLSPELKPMELYKWLQVYKADVLAGLNAEAVNVSVEGKDEPVKHISEIMETCRTWDAETCDYTDEYKYYTWLANHIPEHKATNKNTTELILEEVQERISAAATLAAHGVPKYDIEGAVCAVVNRLAKMEDILHFYNRTEPPQSPETPQTVECTTDAPKPRGTAGKWQNRAIGGILAARPRTCKKFLTVVNVPRIVPHRRRRLFHGRCSTECHIRGVTEMVIGPPGYSPPIRGDCTPRAKHHTTDFKPP